MPITQQQQQQQQSSSTSSTSANPSSSSSSSSAAVGGGTGGGSSSGGPTPRLRSDDPNDCDEVKVFKCEEDEGEGGSSGDDVMNDDKRDLIRATECDQKSNSGRLSPLSPLSPEGYSSSSAAGGSSVHHHSSSSAGNNNFSSASLKNGQQLGGGSREHPGGGLFGSSSSGGKLVDPTSVGMGYPSAITPMSFLGYSYPNGGPLSMVEKLRVGSAFFGLPCNGDVLAQPPPAHMGYPGLSRPYPFGIQYPHYAGLPEVSQVSPWSQGMYPSISGGGSPAGSGGYRNYSPALSSSLPNDIYRGFSPLLSGPGGFGGHSGLGHHLVGTSKHDAHMDNHRERSSSSSLGQRQPLNLSQQQPLNLSMKRRGSFPLDAQQRQEINANNNAGEEESEEKDQNESDNSRTRSRTASLSEYRRDASSAIQSLGTVVEEEQPTPTKVFHVDLDKVPPEPDIGPSSSKEDSDSDSTVSVTEAESAPAPPEEKQPEESDDEDPHPLPVDLSRRQSCPSTILEENAAYLLLEMRRNHLSDKDSRRMMNWNLQDIPELNDDDDNHHHHDSESDMEIDVEKMDDDDEEEQGNNPSPTNPLWWPPISSTAATPPHPSAISMEDYSRVRNFLHSGAYHYQQEEDPAKEDSSHLLPDFYACQDKREQRRPSIDYDSIPLAHLESFRSELFFKGGGVGAAVASASSTTSGVGNNSSSIPPPSRNVGFLGRKQKGKNKRLTRRKQRMKIRKGSSLSDGKSSDGHLNSKPNSESGQSSNSQNEKKKPHIKKPLNAFMLYMKEMRAKVVAECTLKESAAINQILGRRWHSLNREEQSKYYEMARQERQLHMQLYPGWSARDNYGYGAKKKKRKKEKTSDGGREEQAKYYELARRERQLHMQMYPNWSSAQNRTHHEKKRKKKQDQKFDGGNSMKKCRARYGLDQQSQWCKPCRRKKKCIRYLEEANGVGSVGGGGGSTNGMNDDNLGSAGSAGEPLSPDSKAGDSDMDTSSNMGESSPSFITSPGLSLPSPALTSPSGVLLASPAGLASPAVSLPSLQSPLTPSLSEDRPSVSSTASSSSTSTTNYLSAASSSATNNGTSTTSHNHHHHHNSRNHHSSSPHHQHHHNQHQHHHQKHSAFASSSSSSASSPNFGFGLGHLFGNGVVGGSGSPSPNGAYPFPFHQLAGLALTPNAFQKPARNPVGTNPHDVNNPLSVNALCSSASSSVSSLSSERSSSVSSHKSSRSDRGRSRDRGEMMMMGGGVVGVGKGGSGASGGGSAGAGNEGKPTPPVPAAPVIGVS